MLGEAGSFITVKVNNANVRIIIGVDARKKESLPEMTGSFSWGLTGMIDCSQLKRD
jgi:hypothetical protein